MDRVMWSAWRRCSYSRASEVQGFPTGAPERTDSASRSLPSSSPLSLTHSLSRRLPASLAHTRCISRCIVPHSPTSPLRRLPTSGPSTRLVLMLWLCTPCLCLFHPSKSFLQLQFTGNILVLHIRTSKSSSDSLHK